VAKWQNKIVLAGFFIFLTSCVSEKTFDQVMERLDKTETENEKLQGELKRINEEFSGFAETKEALEREAAESKVRADELAEKVSGQEKQIKILSKSKKIVRVPQKPDMSWAKKIINEAQRAFRKEIQSGSIKIKKKEDRLIIRIADSLIFEIDDVEISLAGEEFLSRIGEILKKIKDHQILIGGHLDNIPIAPSLAPEFPTAWEFTATRSTEVVRFLEEESKVSGTVLSAVAFGSAHPLATNATDGGRAQNRRVEIIFLP